MLGSPLDPPNSDAVEGVRWAGMVCAPHGDKAHCCTSHRAQETQCIIKTQQHWDYECYHMNNLHDFFYSLSKIECFSQIHSFGIFLLVILKKFFFTHHG